MKRKSDILSPDFETIKKPTIHYNFVFQTYYYNKYSSYLDLMIAVGYEILQTAAKIACGILIPFSPIK